MTPGLSFPSYEYDRQPNQVTAPHTAQQNRTQITPEEVRLLRECNRESFYYRSIPLAASAMGITYMAVKRGVLKPHPKWGSAIKLSGAAFCGWLLGKLSYRTVCEEKFLHLRNSSIADVIRQKRGLTSEMFEQDRRGQTDDASTFESGSSYANDQDFHLSIGSLNLDTDKNVQFSGLDDRNRPSTDNAMNVSDEESSSVRPTVTYEELRFRNRHGSDSSRGQGPSPSALPPIRSFESYSFPTQHDSNSNRQPTDTHGDRWDR